MANVMALLMSAAIYGKDKSPLCFTARNGSVTVRFDVKNYVIPTVQYFADGKRNVKDVLISHDIQYSTDGKNWKKYVSGSSVTIDADQSVYFRAKRNQIVANAFAYLFFSPASSRSTIYFSQFYFSSDNGGTIEGSGNIMSLYGPDCPDLPLQECAFYNIFKDCKLLTAAPCLPSTTLAEYCYAGMFSGCTSLTTAPSLPAVKLARHCYAGMFKGCTSLTEVPSLPAVTLAKYCYAGMFEGCTSLTKVPSLSARNLAEYCYYKIFAGCTSIIVNTSPPGKEWIIPTTIPNASKNMFEGTSGTMNGTPEDNTIYYIFYTPDAKR